MIPLVSVISHGGSVGERFWTNGCHKFIRRVRWKEDSRSEVGRSELSGQYWTYQMDGSSDESLNYDSPENARIVVIVLWRRSRTLSCNHWYVTHAAHCTRLSALCVWREVTRDLLWRHRYIVH